MHVHVHYNIACSMEAIDIKRRLSSVPCSPLRCSLALHINSYSTADTSSVPLFSSSNLHCSLALKFNVQISPVFLVLQFSMYSTVL